MTGCFGDDLTENIEINETCFIGHDFDDFDEMTGYERIQYLYCMINKHLIAYQHPITGLFTQYSDFDGDSKTFVRDNLYCVLCLWLASLSFKKIDDTQGRTYEMRQAAVKCMRHMLLTFMTHSKNLNRFLTSHEPNDSLPNTLDIHETPIEPHLELHSIALFVLVLCKMTSTGIRVVLTKHEVDFVQHMVFYLERSYRIPDQGIWGNGNRYQNFKREIMSSTLGIVKAALEAASYCNLFGGKDISFMCYVDADALSRNIEILYSSLPRESLTKDIDSALLFIVGFPAFTIDTIHMCTTIVKNAESDLMGRYGFRRFRCDVYGSKQYSDNTMLSENDQIFDYNGLEAQWPMFFALSAINAIFEENSNGLNVYHQKLKDIIVYSQTDGYPVLPQYYYIDRDDIKNGNHQTIINEETRRYFPENKIHLWSQSILITYLLFRGKLVTPTDFILYQNYKVFNSDPNRSSIDSNTSFNSSCFAHNNVVQMTLITETKSMQHKLATYGVITQHISEIKPMLLFSPDEMVKIFANLGINEKLNLNGRPGRPLGVLTTSKIYRLQGKIIISYPIGLEITDFYFNKDIDMFIDRITEKLEFLRTEWSFKGRPTFVMVVRPELFTGRGFSPMIKFLRQLRSGNVDNIRIKMDRLQTLLQTAYVENLGLNIPMEKLENLAMHDKHSSIKEQSERRSSRSSSGVLSKKLLKQDSIFVSFTDDDYAKAQKDLSLEASILDDDIVPRNNNDPTYVSINLSIIDDDENPSADTRDTKLDKLTTHCQNYIASFEDFLEFYNSSEGNVATQLLLLRYAVHTYGIDKELSIDHTTRLNDMNNRIDTPIGSSHTWTIRDEIIYFHKKACVNYDWNVVRYTTSLLSIFVDSLSPNVSFMLISGKPISIGIYGRDEFLYRSPPNPGVILNDICELVGNDAPREASLLQEVITHLRSEISFNPKIFKRLYTLRVGHIIQAMRYVNQWKHEWKRISLTRRKQLPTYNPIIYSLSPLHIKELLQCVLSFTEVKVPTRQYSNITPYQIRVIQGLLGFIPKGFFVDFNFILSRCSMGMKIEGQELARYPNCYMMDQCDFSFGTRIIEIFNQIKLPEIRQIYIETISVVANVLKRNSEVIFTACFNISALVEQAQLLFNKELTRNEAKEFINNCKSLDALPMNGKMCTKAIIMKAFISQILDDNDTSIQLEFS